MSKRTLLAFSIVFSVAVHALLLAVTPRLRLLAADITSIESLVSFEVKLVEDVMPEEDAAETSALGVSSRPGSVEDLLKRETQQLTLSESFLDQATDVPQLAERLSTDPIEREHNLEMDPTNLERVDTKLIEISESAARQDIQVARRLVAPSTDRILGPDELPVLRGSEDRREEALVFDHTPIRTVARPETIPEKPSVMALKTKGPDGSSSDEPPSELRAEEAIARARLTQEIADENPRESIDAVVDFTIETCVPPGEELGYFRVRITPKSGEEIEILPKDVTFILDASSSILQRKLDLTVVAVKKMIESLKPEDRFNVIVFRDTPIEFRQDPVPATPEAKKASLQFLEGLESRGETDVYRAIRPVVLREPRPGIPSVVVLASDGRPTTGIKDARTLINNLTEENTYQNSIFAFGGGRTVNRKVLDLLAYRNKGECYVASRLDEIDDEFATFVAKIEDPILVECRADYQRIIKDSVYPRQIPDFYRGQAVTVYGRFDPKAQGEFAMRLTGRAGSETKEVVFRADLSQGKDGGDSIARDWAFRKVYHLIGETYRLGDQPELLTERRALSEKFDIQTIYDD